MVENAEVGTRRPDKNKRFLSRPTRSEWLPTNTITRIVRTETERTLVNERIFTVDAIRCGRNLFLSDLDNIAEWYTADVQYYFYLISNRC